MRKFAIPPILVLLIALNACVGMGVTPLHRAPATLEESLIMASMTADGFVTTFMRLRVDRTVTSATYDEVIKQCTDVANIVDQGIAAARLGQLTDATDALGRTENVLHVVAAILARVQREPENGA